jgi:SOS-response transcriptional repressor LexA
MLSPRQQRAFNLINGYIESNGVAPTIAEINKFFGYRSTSTGHRILQILETEGFIKRPKFKAWRGIEIVKQESIAA